MKYLLLADAQVTNTSSTSTRRQLVRASASWHFASNQDTMTYTSTVSLLFVALMIKSQNVKRDAKKAKMSPERKGT